MVRHPDSVEQSWLQVSQYCCGDAECEGLHIISGGDGFDVEVLYFIFTCY